MNFSAVINRHDRIALQVSGGRDSLACLYLLRPYWDRLTVYWLNTGDTFPETLDIMARVRAEVPHFVEIAGRQPQVVAQFGLPSDIVPTSRTPFGLAARASTAPMIQDRNDCCARTIMNPLHARMQDAGITLIIRGQKNDDALKGPLQSGAVIDGVEFLYPIEDWTDGDVMAYLRKNDRPIPRFYTMLGGTPDCMTCSAYWEHGVARYLRQHHPAAHTEVQRRLDIIMEAITPHIDHFNSEIAG